MRARVLLALRCGGRAALVVLLLQATAGTRASPAGSSGARRAHAPGTRSARHGPDVAAHGRVRLSAPPPPQHPVPAPVNPRPRLDALAERRLP